MCYLPTSNNNKYTAKANASLAQLIQTLLRLKTIVLFNYSIFRV